MLSGESVDVTQYSLLFALRKYPKPHPIEIHSLSYETLARLVLLEIHKLGYRLSLYAHKYVEAGEAQMCKILRLKLDEVMLNQRNAYLARDLVQMAISHKNDRASKGSSLGSLASAMILSHASFEADLVGKEELDAGKREVQEAVDSMIGWGDALAIGAQDSSGAYVLSPKAFFEKARMTFKSMEDVNMGIGEQPNSWPGNIWVTGSTGTGKTQFVRLAIKYLRWHSALRSDVVVEVNGSVSSSAATPARLSRAGSRKPTEAHCLLTKLTACFRMKKWATRGGRRCSIFCEKQMHRKMPCSSFSLGTATR